jgi:hypothetical protein
MSFFKRFSVKRNANRHIIDGFTLIFALIAKVV